MSNHYEKTVTASVFIYLKSVSSEKNTNVVLDLGANIDCSEKNLVDFSMMGSALHKALYPDENPNAVDPNII